MEIKIIIIQPHTKPMLFYNNTVLKITERSKPGSPHWSNRQLQQHRRLMKLIGKAGSLQAPFLKKKEEVDWNL